jgi:hypothetical protein
LTKELKIHTGKRTSSTNGAGKTGYVNAKH